MTDNNTTANEQPNPGVQFVIKKLYVKDLSLEVPGAPEIFDLEYKPEVKMEMNSRSRAVAEDEYEVELTISLTGIQDDKTMFAVEVQQAGVFVIKGLDTEMKLRHALSAYCPNILFPYVRETVSSLVSRGGLPPLLLAPINFDQLFAAQLQREQQQAQQGEAAAENTSEQ
jgi:preprotein translocase subunit SecB